jgi:hypothetical protein
MKKAIRKKSMLKSNEASATYSALFEEIVIFSLFSVFRTITYKTSIQLCVTSLQIISLVI